MRTTTKEHPVRLRRAWDLSVGDVVWQDNRQRTVQAMLLAPATSDPGDDRPMLHLWFTDAPETHGHAPVIVPVWARADERPPAKPKPGVFSHWLMSAVKEITESNDEYTLDELRNKVIDVIETRHPM